LFAENPHVRERATASGRGGYEAPTDADRDLMSRLVAWTQERALSRTGDDFDPNRWLDVYDRLRLESGYLLSEEPTLHASTQHHQ